MTQIPTRAQGPVPSQNTCDQSGAPEITRHLTRLQLLVPGALHTSNVRSVQECVLAYIEQYQGNVLQLEHEWDLLAAALNTAWQHEEYEVVVRLAAALAYPAGRHSNFAEAKRVLNLGIVASRRTQDREHFASLLNRLGGLLFVHGRYKQGHRLWYTALSFNESHGPLQSLWEPLASFAEIADILENYASTQHFLETYYLTHRVDASDSLAVVLFTRGLYARFMRDLEQACIDFSSCLRLLLPQAPGTALSFSQQLFTVVVQAELARAQGEHARSQQYTETALLLAQAFGDRYTFVALLIDQGMFAYRLNQPDRVRELLPLLHEVERQVEFPNVAAVNRILERYLSENGILLPGPQQPQAPARSSSSLPEPLSEREREVLQLVAAGLSNHEIATRLIVTTATIKKHLEHIYTRLDVHNRTSAVAQARRLKIISRQE